MAWLAQARSASSAEDPTGMTPVPGDANGDRRVSFADLLALEEHFGQTGATYDQGDFTGDGKVAFADYLVLEQNFGKWGPVLPLPPVDAVDPALLEEIKQAIRDGTFELRVSFDRDGLDLHALGVPRIGMLGPGLLDDNGNPDAEWTRRYLTYNPQEIGVNQDDGLMIDTEWPLWGALVTPDVLAANLRKYADTIANVRAIRPGAQVSVFGLPWFPREVAQGWTYAPLMSDAAMDAWAQMAFDQMQPLVDQVDVLAPEFYTRFIDVNVWSTYISRGVTAMQARWPGKPIEPVLYGIMYDTYDTPTGQATLFSNHFIGSDYMLQQVAQTYKLGCAGATIFCEHNWDPATIPWWPAVVSLFQ